MSCCCTVDNRIIIIKKNDTDFNNGNLVEFNITSDIYNITDFTAELILGDIKREFNDLSYGIINFNLSKEETGTLPYGNIDGVMNFIDSQGRVATISSIIPFRVIGIVENDAIKTSDVDYTINVEQGGKNIFNIDVKTNVSVRVGTVETLPSGSSAYVENVGTPTGVVLNFGIPQGIQGEQGIRGEQGIQGEKGDTGSKGEKGDKGDTGATGEAATIQVGTVTTLNPSEPAYVQNVGTEQNAIFNFGIPKGDSGSGANADFSDITGSPYDCDALAAALNEKQNVIEDLQDIRSGAELGSTAVQPSSLATVATSGSYNDLSNKPTIPPAQINSDWDASSGVSQILNKPNLATVATSGSYADLSNKPTIPDEQIQSDWTQSDNTKVDYIKNKPTLATVATSGSYNDLSNKPSIPNALSDIAVAGDNITFESLLYKDITITGSVILNDGIASNFTESNYIDFKDSTRYTTGTTTYYLKVKTPSSGSIQGAILQWNRWANLEFWSGSGLNAWNWGSDSSVNLLADSQVQSDTEYYFKIDVDYENKTKTYSYSLDGTAYTQLASFTDTGMNTSYSNPLRLGNSSYSPSSGGAFTGSIDLGGCCIERSGVEIARGYYANAKTSINTTVDQTYNASSANAQSGKAVASALSVKQNVIEDLPDIRSGAELGSTAVQPSSLATVATSGSYNDLRNKPTIPSAQVNSDWNALSGVAQILNKPDLSVYQTTTNLVTSVSSSSTDSQYPSAKCLYDLCGDIETLINAL